MHYFVTLLFLDIYKLMVFNGVGVIVNMKEVDV